MQKQGSIGDRSTIESTSTNADSKEDLMFEDALEDNDQEANQQTQVYLSKLFCNKESFHNIFVHTKNTKLTLEYQVCLMINKQNAFRKPGRKRKANNLTKRLYV